MTSGSWAAVCQNGDPLQSTLCLSIDLFIHPSIHPQIQKSTHPCIHISMYLCIFASVHYSVYVSIHLPMLHIASLGRLESSLREGSQGFLSSPGIVYIYISIYIYSIEYDIV